MRGLFWNKLPDGAVEASVFSTLDDGGVKLDVAEIESLFRAAAAAAVVTADSNSGATPAAAAAAKAPASPSRPGPVLLLDGKRQQNAGIALARVRLPAEALRRAVLAGDTAVLKPDVVARLLDMVPTPEELQLVRAYEGDRTALGTVEQFFLAVADIPRYLQRLETLATLAQLEGAVTELRARLAAVEGGVSAIRGSGALRGVLQCVMALGNFLNGDSAARGSAYGFKLDTLRKLGTVKGVDNKVTLMDVLARMAVDGRDAAAASMRPLAAELAPVLSARGESLDGVRRRGWGARGGVWAWWSPTILVLPTRCCRSLARSRTWSAPLRLPQH